MRKIIISEKQKRMLDSLTILPPIVRDAQGGLSFQRVEPMVHFFHDALHAILFGDA